MIHRPYPPNCQHALRRLHGGQKPPDLCADLIRVFTKRDALVLDPFMGVGGTLLGAARAGRRALGIEINARWIEIYREVCRREGITRFPAHTGEAASVLEHVDGPFDLVLTDVPYWNMDVAPRSKGRYKRVGSAAQPAAPNRLGRFGAASGYADKEALAGRVCGRCFRLGQRGVSSRADTC